MHVLATVIMNGLEGCTLALCNLTALDVDALGYICIRFGIVNCEIADSLLELAGRVSV